MAESAAAPADWEEPAILRCWWHSPGLMWQYSPPTAKPQTHVNRDDVAITPFCKYCVLHDMRTSRASCWTLPAPWTLSREKRSLKCPMHSVSEPTVHTLTSRIKIISIITNKPLIIWSSSDALKAPGLFLMTLRRASRAISAQRSLWACCCDSTLLVWVMARRVCRYCAWEPT